MSSISNVTHGSSVSACVESKAANRPLALTFVSAPIDTPPSLGSLAENRLCGVNKYGEGIYTTEGITKLCEGLKGGAVTSLKCATAQQCLLSCQRPLTRLPIRHALPLRPSLAQSRRDQHRSQGRLRARAASLKETQITKLRCAAPRSRLVSAP